MGFQARLLSFGRAWKPVLLFAVPLIFLPGCRKPDDIVQYTVPKPTISQAAADTAASDDEEWIPGQLVGAIIPRGERTWYFKLTGPLEEVRSQLEPFLGFIKSVRISAKGPEWSLPDGWQQLPGSEMRFATVKIPVGKEPLELTVIPLPTAAGDFEDSLLSNVNRWREQLRLQPISKGELPEKTVRIELEEMPAWLVNYEGEIRKPGTGKGAPAAGGRFREEK